MEKWVLFWQKVLPVLKAIGGFFVAVGHWISRFCAYIYKLRAIFLAVPVATVAVVQAMINTDRLPSTVEFTMLWLDFAAEKTLFGPLVMNVYYVSKEVAILGPMTLTAVCILLTLFSKRTLFPWIISVLTLLLPTLLYLANVYPA
jgi:hypothetical protein